MKFKVLTDNGFIAEFAPEEASIAIGFLKSLSAPTEREAMLLEELICLLGGKPDSVDYSLMLQ